ncbi:hypothetical protein KUCAC02_037001 [Xyrichtys novacula]|uniref:Uncharacterized protein n=1 Tax=Xyrichtys novacula TaxID=13765 RepID=A0AAV1FB46_XYRNO|nr:hypothetical protein KUCAC02_037001 [Xyrichtys novacula]
MTTKLSAVRKVEAGKGAGKEAVPPKKDHPAEKSTITVSLWREAAVEPLAIGEMVRVTHVRASNTEYGVQVNSTNFTKIEKQLSHQELEVAGVLKDGEGAASSGFFQVLLACGETLMIDEGLWDPSFDAAIQEGILKLRAELEGKKIIKAAM